MALEMNRSNGAPSNNARGEQWKASGFLNFWLPRKDGSREKLGAIPLVEKREHISKLVAWLKEDPARAEVILSKLEIDFQSAEPKKGVEFDL